MKSYGTYIRKLRDQAGLTAAAVAEKLGWSRSKMSMIETGTRNLSLEDAEAVAGVLGVEVGDLVAGQPDGSLGERVRAMRRDKGWSQADLAARLGVLQSQVSGWEKNQRTPSPINTLRLSQAFGVTVDFLENGEGSAETDDEVNDLMENFGEVIAEIAEELNKAEENHPGMAAGFLLLLRGGFLDTPEDIENLLSLVERFRERVRRGTL